MNQSAAGKIQQKTRYATVINGCVICGWRWGEVFAVVSKSCVARTIADSSDLPFSHTPLHRHARTRTENESPRDCCCHLSSPFSAATRRLAGRGRTAAATVAVWRGGGGSGAARPARGSQVAGEGEYHRLYRQSESPPPRARVVPCPAVRYRGHDMRRAARPGR